MRTDLDVVAKLAWGIASIVPVVPFLYALTSDLPHLSPSAPSEALALS